MSTLASKCCLISACLLLTAASLFAQSITGTLTGTVTDLHGAAVPGASVVLRNDASGDARKTVSNQDGYFTVAAVPAGT